MTPGERANHWAKALVTIWPIILVLIGGTVYGNSESVKKWVHGATIEEVDGRTEITEGGMTFEQSVVKNSQEVRIELDAIKAQLNKISRNTSTHSANLKNLIIKWHGVE